MYVAGRPMPSWRWIRAYDETSYSGYAAYCAQFRESIRESLKAMGVWLPA